MRTAKNRRRDRATVGANKSSQVPDQYLGYSLQVTRLLAMLLNGNEGWDEWTVSLEVFEDVGAEGPGGLKIAEQDKSARTTNPVSDASPQLWKTLSNWITAVEAGLLSADKSLFIVYVSSPRTGQIVTSFSQADSQIKALDAVARARRILLRENAYSQSSEAARYFKRVLSGDEETLCRIITNFKLECGSGSPLHDIRSTMKPFIPPEILDDVLSLALGWVKGKTDELLQRGEPAALKVAEFRPFFLSTVRKLDKRTVICSLAGEPKAEQIEANVKQARTYVQQLDLIECDDDQKLKAVSDFLRASANRVEWARRGLVNPSSFDEFEEGLVRTWGNLKEKTEITLSQRTGLEKGRVLYAECSNHSARLEGLDVPTHFIPGSFHALADEMLIGWHPEYKVRISEGGKP